MLSYMANSHLNGIEPSFHIFFYNKVEGSEIVHLLSYFLTINKSFFGIPKVKQEF